MLELVLNSDNGEIVEYNFFPEGKKEYGTITVNKKTGVVDITKRADGDDYDVYLRHAVSKVLNYQKSGSYQQKEMVAWY